MTGVIELSWHAECAETVTVSFNYPLLTMADYKEAVNQIFAKFNKDGEDGLSLTEFGEYLSSIGIKNKKVQGKIFKRIDGPGKSSVGTISRTELRVYLENHQIDLMTQEGRRKLFFCAADKKNNGCYDKSDLIHFFKMLDLSFTDDELSALIQKFDKNGEHEGCLSLDEAAPLFQVE